MVSSRSTVPDNGRLRPRPTVAVVVHTESPIACRPITTGVPLTTRRRIVLSQPSHWKNTADRLPYVEPRGVGRDGTQPHPAGPRVVLLELLVGGRTDVPFAVKRDGARDRGALVEGEDVGRHVGSLAGNTNANRRVYREARQKCVETLGPKGRGDHRLG